MSAIRASALIATVGMVLSASAAHAEIGIPAAPGGIYLSFEGGYQSIDGNPVAALGETIVNDGDPMGGSAACSSIAVGVNLTAVCGVGAGTENAIAFSDGGTFIEAEDGGFGAFTFGYVLPSPLFSFITRVEIVGGGSHSEDDQRTNGAFGMRSVDNTAAFAFAAVPIENVTVDVEQTVETRQATVRFKSDLAPVSGTVLTFSFEPFYLQTEQETTTDAQQQGGQNSAARRTSDVDGKYYGAQVAVEGQVPLVTNVFLIGRGSVGLYQLDVDGAFRDSMFFTGGGIVLNHAVNDDDSTTGYRLGGEAGVKLVMTPSAWLTFFGTVDYLSDTPTAVLPRFADDQKAHIEFEDQMTWGFGARMTFSFNPVGAP